MNNTTKAFLGFLLVGILVIIGLKIGIPIFQDLRQRQSSDSAALKGKIKIGIDNWIGYFPLCSQEMQKSMRSEGYLLECQDDSADYPGRMKKLSDKELDFAVATVDSYLLNGAPYKYPGTMIAVLDESKGGDAFVGRKERFPNLESLKKEQSLKVAFTANSPSDHLLKAAGAHFDIPALRAPQLIRVETNGSSEALEKFRKHEVDLAVLWEPNVSQALSDPGTVKLLSTADTRRLIVDILVVRRDYGKDSAEIVNLLLVNYFRTLKQFRDNPETLKKAIQVSTKLSEKEVDAMLAGVSWVNLTDNGQQWFGLGGGGTIAEEGIVNTIFSTIDILKAAGDFKESPLPDNDPYRLTDRSFLENLLKKGADGFTIPGGSGAAQAAPVAAFSALSEAAWLSLREIGTLKNDPIKFRSGTSDLSLEGKEQLDIIAERISHYPNFRILVKGHSGVVGDPEANKALSQDRAESVSRYLMVAHMLDQNRIRSVGYGGEKPLRQLPGESERDWGYRLPRVEISLLSEVY